ncbi:MAG: hypothetical protein ABIR68_13140 [Ilumatobacteraceae bacterium]
MGSTATILVSTLAVVVVVVVVVVLVMVLMALRRRGAFGTSNGKRAQAMELMQSGRKARAMITAVQPTGMVVNNINLQCIIHFRLDPLGGGEPFDAHKKMLVSQTAMPRVGELWPSWYDPSDPLQFVVGQPTAITPDQVGMFREFGIPHPLDRQAP